MSLDILLLTLSFCALLISIGFFLLLLDTRIPVRESGLLVRELRKSLGPLLEQVTSILEKVDGSLSSVQALLNALEGLNERAKKAAESFSSPGWGLAFRAGMELVRKLFGGRKSKE